MSFVGRCWDTSKTSHGIWTWVYQVATRLQDFEAQITAQPPWQDRFFMEFGGPMFWDTFGYFRGLLVPSWWNGMNWTLIWVDMCWDASFPMLIMHMNIDIDLKGKEDVSLHHCFSVVSWIPKCSCLLNMFFDVGRQVGYQENSRKPSWRLACHSQAHSILQEHINLARNLFVNPQVIISHLSGPDSINWAFLDFVKRPIILTLFTQLHSTWHSTPSTQVIQCLHGLWQEVVTCSSLNWNDQAHWRRGTWYRPRHHGRGETPAGGSRRLETFLIQQCMQRWNGHGKDIYHQSTLGTWYCLDIRSCFELFSRHGSTHWFLSIHFRPLEGGVSLNPINIAKPHRINQKYLFDQQLPCKSQLAKFGRMLTNWSSMWVSWKTCWPTARVSLLHLVRSHNVVICIMSIP